MARTQSSKADKAERLLRKTPEITAAALAKKTGLHLTTIYRSAWWKDRPAAGAQPQTGEK